MARYVAQLLCPQQTVSHAQLLVEQLAAALAAEPQWLDCRNASLVLVLPPQSLSVQVLLEFQQQGAITVLVNSREGMGHGAPQTRHCFEQLLLQLTQQAASTQVVYRSDRDGPILQTDVLASTRSSGG